MQDRAARCSPRAAARERARRRAPPRRPAWNAGELLLGGGSVLLRASRDASTAPRGRAPRRPRDRRSPRLVGRVDAHAVHARCRPSRARRSTWPPRRLRAGASASPSACTGRRQVGVQRVALRPRRGTPRAPGSAPRCPAPRSASPSSTSATPSHVAPASSAARATGHGAVPVARRPSRRPSAQRRRASAPARCGAIAARSTSTRSARYGRLIARSQHRAHRLGDSATRSPGERALARARARERSRRRRAGRRRRVAASTGVEAACEQPADHPGEHVAGPGRGQHGAARGVDAHRAVGGRRRPCGSPSAAHRVGVAPRAPAREPSRSRSSSARRDPVSRPNSPTCGVSTASALRSASSPARPAKALSPSASTHHRDRARAHQVADEAGGLRRRRVSPGPIASACARSSASRTGDERPGGHRPVVGLGSGTNDALRCGGPAPRTGSLAGTATITSPAPIRPAAAAIRRGRARHVARPGDDHQDARRSLVRVHGRAGQRPRRRRRLDEERVGPTEAVGEADVDHAHGAGALGARQEHARPTLAAPNVTVRSACDRVAVDRAGGPVHPGGDVDRHAPGPAPAFRPRSRRPRRPPGMPRNPVPKIASIATSARRELARERRRPNARRTRARPRRVAEVGGGRARGGRRASRRRAPPPARPSERGAAPPRARRPRCSPCRTRPRRGDRTRRPQIDGGARHGAAGALHQHRGGHAARPAWRDRAPRPASG